MEKTKLTADDPKNNLTIRFLNPKPIFKTHYLGNFVVKYPISNIKPCPVCKLKNEKINNSSR